MLHSEYRKIVGENYGTLEELWKAFTNIEQVYFSKIGLARRGEILVAFEREKLRPMVERVVRNVQNQDAMRLQNCEAEIATMKEVAVSPCL